MPNPIMAGVGRRDPPGRAGDLRGHSRQGEGHGSPCIAQYGHSGLAKGVPHSISRSAVPSNLKHLHEETCN